MDIYLHNTLGKKKEEFIPINPEEVRMYSCGPTVYNYAHIGNLRAYVFADILKRTLRYNGYNVKHIVNVTDIGHLTSDADDGEDKMVKALKREGKDMTLENMRSVADFYFGKFREDMHKMNILPANEYPFASDHIKEDEEMVTTLLEKGFAYTTSDGIYFDTSKDSHYGKLGGISGDIEHSRILPNSEKKSPQDFALWKYSDKFDDESSLGFGSADKLGKGFPGWHIECSAMSLKYLGVPFDIHTGGIDHISVHHNNEIAQTECATGKTMANFWMHNEHITIGKDKMAKSGDNFLSLSYLEKNNISPIAYRYWLLTSRYSTRVDFSLGAVMSAQTGFNKNFVEFILTNHLTTLGVVNTEYKNRFIVAINDDLDTPKAITIALELIKNAGISIEDRKATLLDFDQVLGLGLNSVRPAIIEISSEIQTLLDERALAKQNKDWAKSDEIRNKVKDMGYNIKDTGDIQELTRI
jgi:cysteinyl-tRNA synthetase